MKDYRQYTPEEFASDPDFIHWVQHPDENSSTFWYTWLEQNPDCADKVEKASLIVKSIQFAHYRIDQHTRQRIWGKIQTEKHTPATKHIRHFQWINWKASIAAACTLLLIAAFLFWKHIHPAWMEEATAYGETKQVILPDSTSVFLNANSTLRWPATWSKKGSREVWLRGEAFFEVKKIAIQKQDILSFRPFMVHAGALKVKVLGTTFNVFHRRDQTQVVLNSGKVQLSLPKVAKEIMMHPGELVKISENQQQVNQMRVEPAAYTAWKENKLVFKHSTLAEIAATLQDLYGYEVLIEPQELTKEVFSGSTPADQLEVLFMSLESSFNVQVIQDQNKIIIRKKKLSDP